MKIRHLRWWIAALLTAATALSYLDRVSFPNVVKEVRREIPISDTDYSRLMSLFLVAYGLMYAGGGWILDRLGTRWGYFLMITWWSAANFFTGFVGSLAGLKAFRFLLGMGEGGGFPGSGKAVSEWFPPRERSFAFGLFNTGSSLGAIVAAPLLAWLALRFGWRSVFFVTGAAGFLWAVAWLFLYQTPDQSRRITVEERDLIRSSLPRRSAETSRLRWIDLFRYRQVWGLMSAKLLTDSVWYFLLFWLPKYLGDARHFDTKQIGYYAWIPFVFAGAGSFLGGGLGSLLIRRGVPLDRARKIALGSAALLMPATTFIDWTPVHLAIVFYSTAMFGHQFWSANVQTLAADLFPSRVVGSVEGLLGSAGALGAAAIGEAFGRIIAQQHSYSVPFLACGLLHAISFAIILALVRRIEPVSTEVTA
ncbi:MAG TPA: MFS transporter [Planctomycetota bacterium]|jgi:ACS family hexuronate transporter-like MFS transporter|nr:MFS transporter [Planctomycetota bacterium]